MRLTLCEEVILDCSRSVLSGRVRPQLVEDVFANSGLIYRLQVAGKVIDTTVEHPFYVKDREWVACHDLQIGDLIATEDGKWIAVENLIETNEWKTLYNFRVANFATYFVGSHEWNFSVWTHNACVSVRQYRVSPLFHMLYGNRNHYTIEVRTDEGMSVETHQYGDAGGPAIVAYFTRIAASVLTQVGHDWVINVSNTRARAAYFYSNSQIGPHGTYNRWWNSCAVYVRDVLEAAGIPGLPDRPNTPGDVREETRRGIALYQYLGIQTGHTNASGF